MNLIQIAFEFIGQFQHNLAVISNAKFMTSFFHTRQWLVTGERNLLSAVPEERQQVKFISPLASENPCMSNSLNTHPLCQKPANLQMQINKKLNVMSFGAETFIINFFLILGAQMGTS